MKRVDPHARRRGRRVNGPGAAAAGRAAPRPGPPAGRVPGQRLGQRDVPADDAVWARARGWALCLAIAFVAHSADNPQIMTIGRRTLRRVLT